MLFLRIFTLKMLNRRKPRSCPFGDQVFSTQLNRLGLYTAENYSILGATLKLEGF